MAKIYLDEINAFLESNTITGLTNDSREGGNVNNALGLFVEESGTRLASNHWDTYRNTFSEFNKAIQARAALATKLGEAISKALQLLKDYLGDDQMLDSSKLEEYKKHKKTCEESIAKLNEMLNATTQVTRKNSEGQDIVITVPLYDSSDIRAQISKANETITELDRLIAKIEGLDEVYNQAEAILQEAFSDIDSFKTLVGSIVPDKKVSYRRV